MPLTNKLFKNETLEIPLPYPRSLMLPGQEIRFKPLREIKPFLLEAEEIIFSMYWKPLGDSLLFLSVLRAVDDFYSHSMSSPKPKYIVDKKFADLIRRIGFMKQAFVQEDAVLYFKKQLEKGIKSFLITDDNPFWESKNKPIFNSEEFKYPRFYDKSKKEISVYASRPARYYLTFERESQTILFSDPNRSLPFFIQRERETVNQRINSLYGITFHKYGYIGIVAQTSKIEKKFGLLKYLKLAERLLRIYRRSRIIILCNRHEESPKEWLTFARLYKKLQPKVLVYSTENDNFDELSYIFARCEFVIGDDTGFSHLAAMSTTSPMKMPPTTFIFSSKHDYTKWSTGHNNVVHITTKLAEFLAKNNMSVRRNNINQEKWGKEAYASTISIKKVLNKIKDNIVWKK